MTLSQRLPDLRQGISGLDRNGPRTAGTTAGDAMSEPSRGASAAGRGGAAHVVHDRVTYKGEGLPDKEIPDHVPEALEMTRNGRKLRG